MNVSRENEGFFASLRGTLVLTGVLATAFSASACGDDGGSDISAASSRACDHIVVCVQPETPINLDRDQLCQGFDAAIDTLNVTGGACRDAVLTYYNCIEETPCATIVESGDFCQAQSDAAREVCDAPEEEDTGLPLNDEELEALAETACENVATCDGATLPEGDCPLFQGWLTFASFAGQDCADSVDDYLSCVANASCEELDGTTCDALEETADTACTNLPN